jgi:hypothetical protein
MRTLDMNYIKRTLNYHMGYGWSMSRRHSAKRIIRNEETS